MPLGEPPLTSDDVQVVDQLTTSRHGRPIKLPSANGALQELQSAVPEDDDEGVQCYTVEPTNIIICAPCAAAFQAALIASMEGAPTVSVAPLEDEEDEALRRAIEASLRDAGPVSPQMGVGTAEEPSREDGLSDVRRVGQRQAAPVVQPGGGLEALQRDSISSNGDTGQAGEKEWGLHDLGKLKL